MTEAVEGMLDSSQQKTGCPALQEEEINVNVISYEHLIMCCMWACRDTAVPVLVLSPWRPLFLLSVFFFSFFFYLSGRHTRPGVLQLPDDTIEGGLIGSLSCSGATAQLTLEGRDSPLFVSVLHFFPHLFSAGLLFCFVLLICLQFSLEITSNPVFGFLWFIKG